jgi:hypothetical protein
VIHTEQIQKLLDSLPQGELRQVDDRIVADASTWAGPTMTPIVILNRKLSKPDMVPHLHTILQVINELRKGQPAPPETP